MWYSNTRGKCKLTTTDPVLITVVRPTWVVFGVILVTVSKHRVYAGHYSWSWLKLCDRPTTRRAVVLVSSQYDTIRTLLWRGLFVCWLRHDSSTKPPQQLQNMSCVHCSSSVTFGVTVSKQRGRLLQFLTSYLKNVFLCRLRHQKLCPARKI